MYQLLNMSFDQFQIPQQVKTYCFDLLRLPNLFPSFLANKCHYFVPDSLRHHLHLIQIVQFKAAVPPVIHAYRKQHHWAPKKMSVLPLFVYFSKSRRTVIYMIFPKDILKKLVSRSYRNPYSAVMSLSFLRTFSILFHGNAGVLSLSPYSSMLGPDVRQSQNKLLKPFLHTQANTVNPESLLSISMSTYAKLKSTFLPFSHTHRIHSRTYSSGVCWCKLAKSHKSLGVYDIVSLLTICVWPLGACQTSSLDIV